MNKKEEWEKRATRWSKTIFGLDSSKTRIRFAKGDDTHLEPQDASFWDFSVEEKDLCKWYKVKSFKDLAILKTPSSKLKIVTLAKTT